MQRSPWFPHEAGSLMKPIRVVLVDDHQMVVEGVSLAMQQHADVEMVASASTVAEGLRVVGSHHPDVMIADFNLPDGDGLELTRSVRDRWPQTRVVLLTGEVTLDLAEAALDAGCAGFLPKGRTLRELLGAVRLVHEGQASIPVDLLAGLARRRSGDRAGPGDLTARERQVLALVASGATNQAIADELVLSIHTVRNHVKAVLGKLGAHSKLEAVAVARRQGRIGGASRRPAPSGRPGGRG